MMKADLDWSTKDPVILRDWPTGMPGDEIGRQIGVSGESVCVRVRKLREMGHNLPMRGYGQHPAPNGTLPADGRERAGRDPLAALDSVRTCRWIDGDPRELRFCCAPTKPGSSYCPDHHARCYVPRIKARD